MRTGIRVPNCTTFNPGGRAMYFIDTPTNRILPLDLGRDAGALPNQREFAALPPDEGLPDRATVDAEGGLRAARGIFAFHPGVRGVPEPHLRG